MKEIFAQKMVNKIIFIYNNALSPRQQKTKPKTAKEPPPNKKNKQRNKYKHETKQNK